jgi:hypothetical protein
MKGKPWTQELEGRLRELVKAGKDVAAISKILGKSTDSIFSKCKRLGLVEEDAKGYTSSSFSLPQELPSIEEALKILLLSMLNAFGSS